MAQIPVVLSLTQWRVVQVRSWDLGKLESFCQHILLPQSRQVGFSETMRLGKPDGLAQTELGGHAYASHSPGSLFLTFPTRGSTGYAVISPAS